MLPEYKVTLKDLKTPVNRTQNGSGKTDDCTLKLVSAHVNKKNPFKTNKQLVSTNLMTNRKLNSLKVSLHKGDY